MHFCEGALSGYAGVDRPSWDGFDWSALRAATERVMALAAELHRGLAREGVQLILHSFHAGTVSAARLGAIGEAIGPELAALNPAPSFTYPGIVMPASVVGAAAADHVWISAASSSATESLFPAFVVRADGACVGRLERNVPGLLVTDVDTEADVYDSTRGWRDVAMGGTFHSGVTVADPRSSDRTSL